MRELTKYESMFISLYSFTKHSQAFTPEFKWDLDEAYKELTAPLYAYYYTGHDMGNWQFARLDTPIEVTVAELASTKIQNFEANALIGKYYIYAIAFENPVVGLGNFARWDIIDGWTTTIEEAKKKWPSGRHGEKLNVPTGMQ